MNKMPNFLIVGAAKAATTSLYEYLKQHPDIFMSPVKETNYFCQFHAKQFCGPGDEEAVNQIAIRNLRAYSNIFASVGQQKIIGEASPAYLYYYTTVIPQIKKLLAAPKIIIILRNPIERAFSAYMHTIRDHRESLVFYKALACERERIELGWEHLWHYKQMGFYYDQVKAYLDAFSKDNVLVLRYEEFEGSAKQVLTKVYSFLGVEPYLLVDYTNKYNSGKPIHYDYFLRDFYKKYGESLRYRKLMPLQRLYREMGLSGVNFWRRRNNLIVMTQREKKYLLNIFRDDILQLQSLLNMDFSAWLHLAK